MLDIQTLEPHSRMSLDSTWIQQSRKFQQQSFSEVIPESELDGDISPYSPLMNSDSQRDSSIQEDDETEAQEMLDIVNNPQFDLENLASKFDSQSFAAFSKPMISMQKPLGSGQLPSPNQKLLQKREKHSALYHILNILRKVRTHFSRNRRRLVTEQFDLDLTYITERMIAMSVPGFNAMLSLVRNPYSEVKDFLDKYHSKHYKVYNLCAEYPYNGDLFYDSRYAYFPIEDFQPAGLDAMYAFCADASEWLNADPKNVIVVHCKGGKGRTGCMLCGLLCYLGVTELGEYAQYADPECALARFAEERTMDSEGITRASQKRYVREFGKILNNLKFGQFEITHPVRLEKIMISGLRAECRKSKLIVKVYFRQKGASTSKKVVRQEFFHRYSPSYEQQLKQQSSGYTYHVTQDENSIIIDFRALIKSKVQNKWEIDGDIKITVKRTGPLPKTLFYVWFPTMCLTQSGAKSAHFKDLDKPYSHMRGDPQNVKVYIQYEKLDSMPCEGYDHHRNTPRKQSQDLSDVESPQMGTCPSLETMGNQINKEDTGVMQQLDLTESIWEAELCLINCQNKTRQTNINLSMLDDAEKQSRLHRLLTPSRLSLCREDSTQSSEAELFSEYSPAGEDKQEQFDTGRLLYQYANRSQSLEDFQSLNCRTSLRRLPTLPSLEVFQEDQIGESTEDSSDDGGNKSPLAKDHPSSSLHVQNRISFS